MAEISGTDGSVTAGGAALEATEWSADLDCAAPDRSSFLSAGSPRNASGQRTGTITMQGPISTTTNLTGKGIALGVLVTFKLFISVSAGISIQVQGRVTKFNPKNNKDPGPDWSVTAQQYGDPTLVGI